MDTHYQKLAKDFMDLWQKQVSAVVSDRQFIQAMLEMFQTMQPGAHDPKSTTTSSHSAAAADADPGMLAELAFRVAMCEQRLAVLEGQAGKPTGKSGRGGSRKPR